MQKGRKKSGGRYKKPKKRKSHSIAGQPRIVKLGATKKKILRVQGGNKKIVLFSAEIANITDKKTGKCKKAKIKNVIETPSNRFLARQNILNKGAIIDTELGKAKITNRPSQEGNVQAILINKTEKSE